MDRVLALFETWMADRCDRFVVLRDVHGAMRARNDAKLRRAHEVSDLMAPDGVPLVAIARLAGIADISRVCGPDLLPATCQRGLSLGWRHYFLGGAPGVAESVIAHLNEKYPGIAIAGFYCPPFRPLSPDEDALVCEEIRAARPDFVWVGLGTPKQEIWMHEHRGRCGGAIMLGIGAAFDIYAGAVSRAPKWMQRCGLEWLFRLIHDPRRLWRRYLILAPLFICLALGELIRGRITVSAVRPMSPN